LKVCALLIIILMAIGVRPNVRLARELGLALGNSGAIAVNFSQQTSSSSIYAAGDCSEVFHRVSKTWTNIPLGDVANKQGRVAGRNIAGIPVFFPGVVGAQAFKFLNLEVAAVGLNDNEAEKAGYHPVSTLLWDEAVGHSMMETTPLGLKLTADRETGILLGAQAVGSYGAVVRINTLAAALWSGILLDEVCFLDLAYAPSFGHAWDPIHIAAQILMKKMK
jgi:NADPH-dependent 2,4-dienoyl-CoA reductase/sulfur reductase-like enzyme